MFNAIVGEMIEALEANIEFLKREGSNRIILKNGEFLKEIGGLFQYRFFADFLQSIEADVDADIRIGSDRYQGKIYGIKGNEIYLQLNKFAGKSVNTVTLLNANYYLLEKLKEKLIHVNSGEFEVSDLGQKLFNMKDSDYMDNSSERAEVDAGDFNEPQKNALNMSYNSEVIYIWGPPGTGKTEVIGKMIESNLLNNEKTLVLSHTNLATDNAIMKALYYINKDEKQKREYDDGKIIRYGIVCEEIKKNYKGLILENIVEIKNKELVNKKQEILSQIELAKPKLKELKKLMKNYEDYKKSLDSREEILNIIEQKRKKLKNNQDKKKEYENDIAIKRKKIVKYKSYGQIRKFFSAVDVEKKQSQINWIIQSVERVTDRIYRIIKDINNLLKEEKELSKNINLLEKEFKGKDLKGLKKQVDEKEKQSSNLNVQLHDIVQKMDEIESKIISESQIVATTLTKSYLSKCIMDMKYDCVIVDEASMAPLPALWFAAGLAKQRVAVIGDFLQLSPIANYKGKGKDKQKNEKLVKEWLLTDIFSKSKIEQKVRKGIKHRKNFVQLNMQYRMHPRIAELVNELVYTKIGGEKKYKLENGKNDEKFNLSLLAKNPLEGYRVGVYDISKLGVFSTRSDNGSYYNIYTAFLSIYFAKQATDNKFKNVGIITPFRAQSNLLNRILKDKEIEYTKIEANTVHRFQGKEKDLIIFDVTRSGRTKMLDDQERGGDDERLINVALSRAVEKCIIICDVERIQKSHSDSSLIKRSINFMRKKVWPIRDASSFVNKYFETEISEKMIEIIINNPEDFEKNKNIYSENNFYCKFINDLLSARKEVVIDSPYITTNRVEKLLPIFKLLLQKNISIILMTRMASDHGGVMKMNAVIEMERLSNMGIVVLPFAGKIHRKVAIIDREILWFGSLNILSQRDSKEMMVRFEGKESASAVIEFLGINKNIGGVGENKLKKCTICKKPGAYFWTGPGQFGEWTHCLAGNHKEGKEPKSEEEIKKRKEETKQYRKMKKDRDETGAPICPKCGIPMVKRKKYGEFWGCANYPRCRITEKTTGARHQNSE